MSTDYTIVPSSIRHVKPMSARMRAAGAIAVQAFGLVPRAALHRAFAASCYCRTALKDDRPVAMWGVAAPILGDTAMIWLVLAEDTGIPPLPIIRKAREELERVADTYPRVLMTVLPDDEDSVAFALFLGFRPTDGEVFGSGGDITVDPRFRIPIGDSYIVQMGYAPTMVN